MSYVCISCKCMYNLTNILHTFSKHSSYILWCKVFSITTIMDSSFPPVLGYSSVFSSHLFPSSQYHMHMCIQHGIYSFCVFKSEREIQILPIVSNFISEQMQIELYVFSFMLLSLAPNPHLGKCIMFKSKSSWAWKNSSVATRDLCSPRECGFDFQHPYGVLQLSVTPPPEPLMPPSGHWVHRLECRQNMQMHKLNK